MLVNKRLISSDTPVDEPICTLTDPSLRYSENATPGIAVMINHHNFHPPWVAGTAMNDSG